MVKYIAIDGLDLRGKATQSRMLVENLTRFCNTCALVELPRRHAVSGKLIYWMLNNGLAKMFPTLFQTVQSFNKFSFQTFELYTGFLDYVVFDRWSASALAYGTASGVSPFLLTLLNFSLVKPVITIVLTGKKLKRDEKEDSYEADSEFQTRVGMVYDSLVASREDFVAVSNLDSEGKLRTPEDIQGEILQILLDRDIIDTSGINTQFVTAEA